ncbi:glycoside hydrolase family 128 protein [Collybiopsis luxurians FD-317 M1]|uniref:Glycoside hydrolase family 128 protein n=1 Tax=Collybiopsis luxurians FD-317 M1 TaxID=944289 RepID=A0A0D0B1W1_9AGAR|nr:glycoside hydrolase family 128 protein [Collybiopsis luxurians FD-317 M1]
MAFSLISRLTLVVACLSLIAVPAAAVPNSGSASSSASSSSAAASSGSSNSTVAASNTPASTTQAGTTATSATTTAAPTTTNGKNAKRGLSYVGTDNTQDVLNINQTKSVVSWQYDWGLIPPANLAQSGVEYIPMQWGSSGIENLSQTVQAYGIKTLLTFNEPDFNQQSNIDPNFAAQLWQQYIDPLRKIAPGIKIGAPAVSSGGTGLPWLSTFFGACGNCTFDFLPIHWYGEGVAGFYDYLYQVYGEFGNKTIWVTEFAETSLNDTEVTDFLNQTTAFMDGLAFVERYAWFGYFVSTQTSRLIDQTDPNLPRQRPQNGSAYNMLNNNGSLNDLGTLYIGADTVETSGPATNTAANVAGGGPAGPGYATVSVAPGHAPTFSPNGALSSREGMITALGSLAALVLGSLLM